MSVLLAGVAFARPMTSSAADIVTLDPNVYQIDAKVTAPDAVQPSALNNMKAWAAKSVTPNYTGGKPDGTFTITLTAWGNFPATGSLMLGNNVLVTDTIASPFVLAGQASAITYNGSSQPADVRYNESTNVITWSVPVTSINTPVSISFVVGLSTAAGSWNENIWYPTNTNVTAGFDYTVTSGPFSWNNGNLVNKISIADKDFYGNPLSFTINPPNASTGHSTFYVSDTSDNQTYTCTLSSNVISPNPNY